MSAKTAEPRSTTYLLVSQVWDSKLNIVYTRFRIELYREIAQGAAGNFLVNSSKKFFYLYDTVRCVLSACRIRQRRSLISCVSIYSEKY